LTPKWSSCIYFLELELGNRSEKNGKISRKLEEFSKGKMRFGLLI
tara:strand:+ start:46 stop:180 length:135 start_codon:yes stop_codon:yes gene_type:complete